nr:MAG TPA: hypothetical protein [Caudoviricetes sp.]DAY11311.1 MAG TPA: hypothetical protein [Caudoviricetes sp.]
MSWFLLLSFFHIVVTFFQAYNCVVERRCLYV